MKFLKHLVIIGLFFGIALLPSSSMGWGVATVGVGQLAHPVQPGSWDLLDEGFSSLGSWFDNDSGSGASTIDPAGQLKLDSGSNASGNDDSANRTKDIGSIPNTFTLEVSVYHDALGQQAATDFFSVYIFQGDELVNFIFASNGLFLRTSGGYNEVGTDLVLQGGSAEWQIWRFCVTLTGTAGAGTCDIYLKDTTHDWSLITSSAACSLATTSQPDGSVWVVQYGYTTTYRITHVDYFKIATGLTAP